jgi:hypothetical protein
MRGVSNARIAMTSSSKPKKPVSVAETSGVQLPNIRGNDIPTVPEVCPGAQTTSDEDPIQSFAVAITKGWQKNVRAILEVSKICAEAANVLDMAERLTLIDRLPFDRTVFSKLAAIGRCLVLYNPEVESSLPPNYTTLYIARKLSAKELDSAIETKVLTPNCSREGLRQWVSDPNNCHYGAATKPRPDPASNAAQQGESIGSLLEAWKASPDLIAQWRRASYAVRIGFFRELKKL